MSKTYSCGNKKKPFFIQIIWCSDCVIQYNAPSFVCTLYQFVKAKLYVPLTLHVKNSYCAIVKVRLKFLSRFIDSAMVTISIKIKNNLIYARNWFLKLCVVEKPVYLRQNKLNRFVIPCRINKYHKICCYSIYFFHRNAGKICSSHLSWNWKLYCLIYYFFNWKIKLINEKKWKNRPDEVSLNHFWNRVMIQGGEVKTWRLGLPM